ncbi:hypothetical protein ACFLQ2_05680, partial [archaeon]
MEDLDFGESMPKLNFDLKKIGTIVVAVVVVAALVYLGMGAVNQSAVSMQFEDAKVSVGESTQLKVVVVNTGAEDAKAVNVLVETASTVLTVTEPSRTEAIIGSKATRQLVFTVSVAAAATPGTYKVTAKVNKIDGEEQV